MGVRKRVERLTLILLGAVTTDRSSAFLLVPLGVSLSTSIGSAIFPGLSLVNLLVQTIWLSKYPQGMSMHIRNTPPKTTELFAAAARMCLVNRHDDGKGEF